MRAILILIALCMFCSSSNSQPRDCDSNPSPCDAFASADAVFVGKVNKIVPEYIRDIWTRDKDYDQTAYVSVEATYKGVARRAIVLRQLGRADAPKFIAGSRYLFYADRDSKTGRWWVKPCGRTRMAEYVEDDLRYIRTTRLSGNRSRIAGEISQYAIDPENPAETTRRMPGVTVHVIGRDKKYTTVTDEHGVDELLDLPPGTYRIQPAIPNGLRLWAALHYGRFDPTKLQSLEVDLSPHNCSGLTIILTGSSPSAIRKVGN